MNFYLLDRVRTLKSCESIEAIKCWSLSNKIFDTHFPTMPIVPGVLLIESMAQALGILIERSYAKIHPSCSSEIWAMLSIVKNAKFKKNVLPGDKTIIHGSLSSIDKNLAICKSRILVENELAASAELIFKIGSPEISTHRLKRLSTHRKEMYEILFSKPFKAAKDAYQESSL